MPLFETVTEIFVEIIFEGFLVRMFRWIGNRLVALDEFIFRRKKKKEKTTNLNNEDQSG